jgi:hypothetical protein
MQATETIIKSFLYNLGDCLQTFSYVDLKYFINNVVFKVWGLFMSVFFFNVFSFIKAKSDIASEDLQALVKLGLEVFHASHNKFVVQVMLSSNDLYMVVQICLVFGDIFFSW